jgi:hypothetical protein
MAIGTNYIQYVEISYLKVSEVLKHHAPFKHMKVHRIFQIFGGDSLYITVKSSATEDILNNLRGRLLMKILRSVSTIQEDPYPERLRGRGIRSQTLSACV